MNKKLVSIIVPTYNMENLITETVENCLSQNYPNIELVIVDDGSTDATGDVVSRIISENPNRPIKYLTQPNSGGPAMPRNIGFHHSSGEYIQFLDADDLITNDKISRQVDLCESASIGNGDVVAYCDYRFFKVKENGEKFLHRMGPPDIMHWPESLSSQLEMYTVVHRFLYPRRVLEEHGAFDPDMNHTEDLDLWIRLLIKGVEFRYEARPMALYREHVSHSLSHPLGQAEGRLRTIEKVATYLTEANLLARYQNEVDRMRTYWKNEIDFLKAQGVDR